MGKFVGYLPSLEGEMDPSDTMKTSPQGGSIKNTPIVVQCQMVRIENVYKK